MRGILALAVVGALTFAAPAWADRDNSNNNTSKKLRQAVTVAGILEHQSAFQDISEFTGGNRLSGTPGYDASADYVAERAAAAGLEVSRFDFDYELDLLADYTPPVLDVVAGGPARSFVPGIAGALFGGDFGSMYASPSGDVTAPVWAADLDLDPATAASNTSGCQAADYAGIPQRAIVLLQNGTSCSLGTKFFGAQQFGASAIVFFDVAAGPIWVNVTGIDTPSIAATVERAPIRRRT
jgi:hypothetical protein